MSSSRSSSSASIASLSAPALGSGIFLDLLEGSMACPDFETSPWYKSSKESPSGLSKSSC